MVWSGVVGTIRQVTNISRRVYNLRICSICSVGLDWIHFLYRLLLYVVYIVALGRVVLGLSVEFVAKNSVRTSSIIVYPNVSITY